MLLEEIAGDFKLLTLEDHDILKQYQEDMKISDMGFTQLYAWQEVFHNRYRIINDYVCAIYEKNDGSLSCYAPLGNYEKERYQKTILIMADWLKEHQLPLKFDFVPENWLERFENLPGYRMKASFHEDFSDYIFRAEDFLCLTGRINEKKRYQVNYFEKHFAYRYESLWEENKEDAYRVLERWCEGRDCKSCYWGCEKQAIERILEHWSSLDCKGAVIYVDEVPSAFMIGEQIGKSMVVSHFQKADKRIKGLYAWLSHEFYLREYPGIPYINLQEDMGVFSVRESKLFYRPCHMMRKYTVTLIPEIRGGE